MNSLRGLRALTVTMSLATIACGPLGVEATSGDSTESTTASTEDESGDASTTVFGPPADTSIATCDPFAQDCPAGEKCVAYSSSGGIWDANKCVPIMGDQAPGEPCTWGGIVEATDDCDATGFCWDVQDVDGELVGTCVPSCTGTEDSPQCPPGSTCLVGYGGSLTPCIRDCDPLVQDCNSGLGCFWIGDRFNCVFTSQDIPAGQPCGFVNDCAAGLICSLGESLPSCDGAACCSSFCDVNLGDAPCEALLPGTVCAAFFAPDEAPEGYEDVGVCVVL